MFIDEFYEFSRLKIYNKLSLSDVDVVNSEVLSGTLATLSCVVTGLTKTLESVSWEKPDGSSITASGNGFIFDDGSTNFDDSSQTTTLTIPTDQTIDDVTYKCVVQSDEHNVLGRKIDVQSKVFSKLTTLIK